MSELESSIVVEAEADRRPALPASFSPGQSSFGIEAPASAGLVENGGHRFRHGLFFCFPRSSRRSRGAINVARAAKPGHFTRTGPGRNNSTISAVPAAKVERMKGHRP